MEILNEIKEKAEQARRDFEIYLIELQGGIRVFSPKKNYPKQPDDCAICTESFVQGEPGACHLDCKHWFHYGCLSKWVIDKNTCPKCRQVTRRVAKVL